VVHLYWKFWLWWCHPVLRGMKQFAGESVDRNSKPKIIKTKEIEEVANQIRIKYAPNAAGGEGAGRRTKRAPNARQAPAWAEGRVAPA
jgi:hypothetical protein